jgi:hypothetical protein
VIVRMRCIAIGLLALLLGACDREHPLASDCGNASPLPAIDASGAWGPADTPVYLVRDDGSVMRGTMTGKEWKTVSDHDFEEDAFGLVSRDRRWLVIQGKRRNSQETWLYDTKTGRDHIVLRRALGAEALALLSPDGYTIAVYANPDPNKAPAGNTDTGLYLIDTNSGTARRVGLPPQLRIDPVRHHGSLRWDADGVSLYLIVHDFTYPTYVTEIYRVTPVDGRFERVTGTYNQDSYRPDLRVEGKQVPLSDWLWMQSQLRWRFDVKSADGTFEASIDPASHALSVRGADGVARSVARGAQTECGSSIVIREWAGPYLVYTLDHVAYLHDPTRHRTRRLFEEGRGEYFW